MAESSLYVVFPIIISALALIISALGYLNSTKSLKISEKEHKISQEEHELTKEKEDKKENLISFLKILNDTSKTLKELPDDITFDNFDYLMSDVMHEVYENKKFILSIKLKNLYVNGQNVSSEAIHNEKFLKDEIKKYSNYFKEHGVLNGQYLNYETSPKLPYSDMFDLSMIFYILSHIEQNIDDLKEFELFINSFDSGLLDTIKNEYDEILKLIYKTLNKRTFLFELNSDMKPSDIEKTLQDSLYLTEIKDKSEFMATVLKCRVDKISKELTMRVLTQ